MSFWISLLNDISVSFFGSILSASFCDALNTRKNRRIFTGTMLLLPVLQGFIYFFWGAEFLRQIYPLVVHLPLLLLLYILTGKLLWPLFSILSAYLCCQVRRWIALFAVALLSGGTMMHDLLELLLTVPLLLLLLRYAAPAFRQLSGYSARTQCQLGCIPALYYAFDYLTAVYTNLLASGNPVAVEFMPFVCCAAYLVFLLYNSVREHTQIQLKQAQKSLGIQLNQAVREINALRESQTLAIRYRHDMRHHLQYVSSCIQNGQTKQAQAYINGICKEIDAQKSEHYCENEAANLILSAFAGRAQNNGIQIKISGTLPASIRISDSDLCVLLSNALENALHACLSIDNKEACVINVQFYIRDKRLFLQIENPCCGDITFENEIPVSHEPGHGIGVQSICAIAEHYGGIYTFLVKDGHFILRLSI